MFKSRPVDTSPQTALATAQGTPPAPWWPALRMTTMIAVVFTLGNATWAAWDQDITYDEPFHLTWPERLLEDRDDSRDQFRFDSKTPALLPAVVIRKALRAAGVESEQVLRFSTRLPSLVFLAGVLFLVARLARTENPGTSWIAVLLAALDPNLAAHASIATTDLCYALAVLLLALAIGSKRNERWSMARAVMIGMAVGLAFAVKYSAVLLVPVAAIAILARGLPTNSARAGLAQIALATLAAGLTMNTLYLWVGVSKPLGSLSLQTPSLGAFAAALPSLPLPIPRSVVTGIDLSMAHNNPNLWASYLFGQEHRGGVWYYFIAQWLMKTPVALVAATLMGLWGVRRGWRDPLVASLSALLTLHLGYFSLFFATQIGLRFALPCLALGCVLAARGLGSVRPPWLIAVAIFSLAERTAYWEDPIAFTNVAVWPKSRAYWFTADSNLDYGQNRERVERYSKKTGLAMVMDQATITPGLYVAGANELAIFDSRRSHRWLIDNDVPAITVGFSHFAFSITGERFDEYLTAARTAPQISNADGVCAPPLPHYPPGGQITFEQRVGPGQGRAWLVCVSSRKGADLGFKVSVGRLWFGRVTREGGCEADLLQEGQQAWFRVPRGSDTRLCLREIPFRRPELPYLTSGYFTVRGQGADVEIRPIPFETLRLN